MLEPRNKIFYVCNNVTQHGINGELMNQEVWFVTRNGVGTSFVCFVCRTSPAGTFGANRTFESIKPSVLSPWEQGRNAQSVKGAVCDCSWIFFKICRHSWRKVCFFVFCCRANWRLQLINDRLFSRRTPDQQSISDQIHQYSVVIMSASQRSIRNSMRGEGDQLQSG